MSLPKIILLYITLENTGSGQWVSIVFGESAVTDTLAVPVIQILPVIVRVDRTDFDTFIGGVISIEPSNLGALGHTALGMIIGEESIRAARQACVIILVAIGIFRTDLHTAHRRVISKEPLRTVLNTGGVRGVEVEDQSIGGGALGQAKVRGLIRMEPIGAGLQALECQHRAEVCLGTGLFAFLGGFQGECPWFVRALLDAGSDG